MNEKQTVRMQLQYLLDIIVLHFQQIKRDP